MKMTESPTDQLREKAIEILKEMQGSLAYLYSNVPSSIYKEQIMQAIKEAYEAVQNAGTQETEEHWGEEKNKESFESQRKYILVRMNRLKKDMKRSRKEWGRLNELIQVERKVFADVEKELAVLKGIIEKLKQREADISSEKSKEVAEKLISKLNSEINALTNKISGQIAKQQDVHGTGVADLLKAIKVSKEERQLISFLIPQVENYCNGLGHTADAARWQQVKRKFQYWANNLFEFIDANNELLQEDKFFDNFEKHIIDELQEIIRESQKTTREDLVMRADNAMNDQKPFMNSLISKCERVVKELEGYFESYRNRDNLNRETNYYHFGAKLKHKVESLDQFLSELDGFIEEFSKEFGAQQ